MPAKKGNTGRLVGGRRASATGRVLVLIASSEWGSETRRGLIMTKRAMAQELGLCTDTIARAVTTLCRDGLIERTARGTQTGASLPNRYRATDKGLVEAARIIRCMTIAK